MCPRGSFSGIELVFPLGMVRWRNFDHYLYLAETGLAPAIQLLFEPDILGGNDSV